MKKEKIINGCEFQDGCIEYKDISYLKVMPICAIYELSIACHHKVDKCKYYQVYKQLKHLKQENEKLKTQYNCYACGNCKGKEDYINLEKHHKGLRKQFDELVKRNNTLSLRIEELEKENEQLRDIQEIIKIPDYYNSLDWEAKGHRAITMIEEIRQIIAEQKESENN